MGSDGQRPVVDPSCPAGWQVVPLPDVVSFQEGPGILAKDFRSAGVPLVRLKGVEGDFVTLDGCNFLDPDAVARRWKHFRLQLGDLVISTSASFGRVSEVTNETVGTIPYTGLIRFQPREGVLEREFLRAFLGSANFMRQVEAMASGSVIRHFGPMHLKQMVVQVPPLSEQREIGSLYSAIANRLRALRTTNASLEAIAQALFKSWFVDFDPVHAKAEGRAPAGMDAATAALFPSEFEDSELGPIPNGWRSFAFGDLAQQHTGSVNPGESPSDTFQHYSLPAFDASRLPVREQGESIKSNKTPVPDGAVLVSKLNPHIPRVWFVSEAGNNAVCSTEFLVWTPKRGFSEAIVYCAATSRDFNAAMRQLVTGTSNSHQRVRPAALAGIRVAVANQEAIKAFGDMAAPLLARLEHSRHEAATLAALRDALLPRLISGKLRLPEPTEAAETVPA